MSKAKQTIGVIGCGNMGAAIIAGIAEDYSVKICDTQKEKVRKLVKQFKVEDAQMKEIFETCDVIIVAVKPQAFEELFVKIKSFDFKNKLIISIAAGIKLSYLEKKVGANNRVIRAMPNLPVQVGAGITAVSLGKKVTPKDSKLTTQVFEKIGSVIITEEKNMDAVTAVSGSGPAYVALFMEIFVKAAKTLGLPQNVSEELVVETIKGTLTLLETNKENPEAMKKRVTSKGGTTEAALEVFTKHKFEQTFKYALKASKRRARELSK